MIRQISKLAEDAAKRYEYFTVTLGGLYKSALMSNKLGHAGQGVKLKNDALEAAQLFFDIEKAAIESDIFGIAENAHTRTLSRIDSVDHSNLSVDTVNALNEIQTQLSVEISSQMQRDIAEARSNLQKATLVILAESRLKNRNLRAAQLNYLASNGADLDLAFRDRKGRKTPSRSFVRIVYRMALLTAWNTAVMMDLVDHGIDHAAVSTFAEGVYMQVGTMTPIEYIQQLQEKFHPNSNLFLDVEVDDDV